jgi:hypothetical protein
LQPENIRIRANRAVKIYRALFLNMDVPPFHGLIDYGMIDFFPKIRGFFKILILASQIL